MEYLFAFQFCYCERCVESRWEREGGGAESIILLIFVLWHCFNHRWVVRWGRKSYLGPAEIASFPIRDLSWHNKHESFWHVVSTGYFYVFFLWAIAVWDSLPMELYRHLVLSLSIITFTANSQADNHFSIYVYLFQILYSMKSVFYKNTR